MNAPAGSLDRLRVLELYHFDEERPYSRTWLFVLLYGLYAPISMLVLFMSASVQYRLPALVVSVAISSVVFVSYTLWVALPTESTVRFFSNDWNVPYLLAGPLFVLLYLFIHAYSSAGPGLITSRTAPQVLIAILYSMMFALLIAFFDSPIRPNGLGTITDRIGFVEFYIENWYRTVRLAISSILVYSVGVAVTYVVQNEITSTPLLLVYNIPIMIPIFFVYTGYISKKHLYLLSVLNEEYAHGDDAT